MVSVIIPTYNKLSRLKLTIKSLIHQNFTQKYELLIVDNESTDGTSEYLETIKNNFHIMKIIRIKKFGRAYARNVGIKNATGELIIMIDDDMILPFSFIRTHVDMQKKPQIAHGQIFELPYLKFFQDPSQGILYGDTKKVGNNFELLKKMCINEIDISDNFEKKILHRAKKSGLEETIQKVMIGTCNNACWLGFTGGNISIPKKWLDDMGGFDEKFGINWGCEDIELGYRLVKAGYPIIYAEEAFNIHITHYRESYKDEHQKNIDYFYQKHGDSLIIDFHKYVTGEVTQKQFIQKMFNY